MYICHEFKHCIVTFFHSNLDTALALVVCVVVISAFLNQEAGNLLVAIF